MPLRLSHIDDYPTRARDRLPWQFRGADRMHALMAAIGCGLQRQEDDQWAVYHDSLLETADGDGLDQIGELVNLERLTLDDHTYRLLIRAVIPANLSEGTLDELIEIYRKATDPSEIESFYHFPAGIRLTAFRARPMGDKRVRAVKRIMGRARPGGVGLTLSEAVPSPIRLSTSQGFNNTLSRVL